MTQTVPQIPARSPGGPPPRESVVHRLTLRNVPWPLYEQLLQVVGNGLPRMTYDRGALEIERPSERHETLKWIAGRFIEAYAEETGIDYKAVGSTTWRKQSIDGGVEADESYYFQNYHLVHGRESDLATDPPPDLALEIDLSPPDVEKTSIHARLGVPEIWRWRDERLTVLVRQPAGEYLEAQRSAALPDFPLPLLAEALVGYITLEPAKRVAAFRRSLRT